MEEGIVPKTIIYVKGKPVVITGREVIETRTIVKADDLPQFSGSLEAAEAIEAGILACAMRA